MRSACATRTPLTYRPSSAPDRRPDCSTPSPSGKLQIPIGKRSIQLITISDRSKSAVEALVELARRGGQGPVPILEISEARKLPLHVLEQLFASLRRTGILKSQRGVRGGYSFARPADEVTLLDVVECVDGAIVGSVDRTPSPVDEIWQGLCEMLSQQLAAITIAQVVEREIQASGTMMFHI